MSEFAIVGRLTSAQRARVRRRTWWLRPYSFLDRPVLTNADGDCPLACALGGGGAIGSSEVAARLTGRRFATGGDALLAGDEEWTDVAGEAQEFIDAADLGHGGEDCTEWVRDVFA